VRAIDDAGNIDTETHFEELETHKNWSDVSGIVGIGSTCSGCHTHTYDSIVNQEPAISSGMSYNACGGDGPLYLITPGSPEDSYLYRKMNAQGDTADPWTPMCGNAYYGVLCPLGVSEPLCDQLVILRDWIEDGALED
jgi:hypothetical protein